MKRLVAHHPWIIIAAAFTLLVGMWSCFIYVAVTRGPAVLPLHSDVTSSHAAH
jgi:hypothetical protein